MLPLQSHQENADRHRQSSCNLSSRTFPSAPALTAQWNIQAAELHSWSQTPHLYHFLLKALIFILDSCIDLLNSYQLFLSLFGSTWSRKSFRSHMPLKDMFGFLVYLNVILIHHIYVKSIFDHSFGHDHLIIHFIAIIPLVHTDSYTDPFMLQLHHRKRAIDLRKDSIWLFPFTASMRVFCFVC